MRVVLNTQHSHHSTGDLQLLDGSRTLEIPERLNEIVRGVADAGGSASESARDHGINPIAAVHEGRYLAFLERGFDDARKHDVGLAALYPGSFASRRGSTYSPAPTAQAGYFGADIFSPILAGTWHAIYHGAQAAMTAVDIVLSDGGVAYAATRPPGHHAFADIYGGFCYLNNAAIAARYAQTRSGSTIPIAILDIDFHHGNGTQQIFYDDPSVLFCSLHGDPQCYYPYHWGSEVERGEGPGEGATRNLVIPAGATDSDYLAVLRRATAEIRRFRPHLLIVSVGFDIAEGDPYAPSGASPGARISPEGFRAIAGEIGALGYPTALIQEGGYRMDTLRKNAAHFFKEWC